MALKRRAGIVRRPIEYVLPAVLIGLIIVLALAIRSVNRTVQTHQAVDKSSETESVEGTFDGIGQLTEDDQQREEAFDRQADRTEQNMSAVDAAADNIGGVYDEAAY